jgi:hypothetical protein
MIIMIETQLTDLNLTDANIYLKDGSRKFVAIVGDMFKPTQQIIQFISNSNLSQFMETKNPNYIESIDALCIEGIDMDLK